MKAGRGCRGRTAFDPERSQLERDPGKLQRYIQMIEDALGHQARVTGVLEIGSHAKGEAVPTSDTDTRVYVTSPIAYLFNLSGRPEQPLHSRFVKELGVLPRRDYAWEQLNGPVSRRISERLESDVEFGFADQRYASFELSHLDLLPSYEHSLLFQSRILHDPDGFLRQERGQLKGKIFQPLVAFYWERVHDRVSRRIHGFLRPHKWDEDKLEKSGQIQWIQQAVRCLRDAVAAKTYASTGAFLYKKADVLGFYRQHLPDDFAFVHELYTWKTDPTVRAEMVQAFRRDSDACYGRFRAQMPQLKDVVAKVRDLA